MLRRNFLFKFFRYKRNSTHEITQYDFNKKSSLENAINVKIVETDQKISENSKALIEAQIVKIRSTFSKSNNFLEKIGQSVYKTKLEDSINWHQEQLKELYFQRRELEISLEKLKGTFWINQIKRFLKIIFIGLFIFLSLFIFFSGFIILVYLLPLIILIFLGYLISTKRY